MCIVKFAYPAVIPYNWHQYFHANLILSAAEITSGKYNTTSENSTVLEDNTEMIPPSTMTLC